VALWAQSAQDLQEAQLLDLSRQSIQSQVSTGGSVNATRAINELLMKTKQTEADLTASFNHHLFVTPSQRPAWLLLYKYL